MVNQAHREVLNGVPREYIESPPRGFLKANPRPHPRPDPRPKTRGAAESTTTLRRNKSDVFQVVGSQELGTNRLPTPQSAGPSPTKVVPRADNPHTLLSTWTQSTCLRNRALRRGMARSPTTPQDQAGWHNFSTDCWQGQHQAERKGTASPSTFKQITRLASWTHQYRGSKRQGPIKKVILFCP